MKPGFAEKQFFSLRNIVFSHMLWLPPIHSKSQGIELGTWNIVLAQQLDENLATQDVAQEPQRRHIC